MCAGCTDVRGYMPSAPAMNIGSIGLREGVMFALIAVAASLSVMEEALALGKTLLYIHRARPPKPRPQQLVDVAASDAPSAGCCSRLWTSKRILLLCLQQVRILMLASSRTTWR